MLFSRLKQAWKRFLTRLAKQNQASFGAEPLDCCRVGRESRQRPDKR